MKTALLGDEQIADGIAKHAIEAAEEAAPEDRVRTGLSTVLEEAEADPAAARSALHELRADPRCLDRLERWLGGKPGRTTFGLGAAIQLVNTELSSADPDLERIAPELLRWLEGDW